MSISTCVCRKKSRSKSNEILIGLLIGDLFSLCFSRFQILFNELIRNKHKLFKCLKTIIK